MIKKLIALIVLSAKISVLLSILSVFQLQETEAEFDVLAMHHRLVTGLELADMSPRLVHPRVTYLMNRRDWLPEKIEKLEKQVAHRPTPTQVR